MSDQVITCAQAVKFTKQANVLRMIFQDGVRHVIFAGYAKLTVHRGAVSSIDYTINIEEATAVDGLDHDQIRSYFDKVFEATDYDSIFVNKITVTYDTMRQKDRHLVEDFWPMPEKTPVPGPTELHVLPSSITDVAAFLSTNSSSIPSGWIGDVVLFCIETSKDGFMRNCGFVMFEPNAHAFVREIFLVQNKKQASIIQYARAELFIDVARRQADPNSSVVREYITLFV